MHRLLWCDVTCHALDRRNRVSEGGEEAGGVGVCCEDDVGGVEGAAWCVEDVDAGR